jgi:hypothetical protein
MCTIYYYLFLLFFTYKNDRITGEVYAKQPTAILIVAPYGRCWINVDSTQSQSIQMCQRMSWVRKNGKWEIGF